MRIIQLIKTMIIRKWIIQLIKTMNENYPTNKNNDYKRMRIIKIIKTMILKNLELSN